MSIAMFPGSTAHRLDDDDADKSPFGGFLHFYVRQKPSEVGC